MRSFLPLTVAAVLLGGCGETATEATRLPEPDAAFGAMVSEPVAIAARASRGGVSGNSGSVDPLVWVALPPASVPGGVEVTAVNQRTGASTAAPVVEGGFDPVALPALAGDTLRLEVALASGGMASARVAVPARRRPRVVRTRPAAGRRDVAITSSVVVVFSEPIAPASIDPADIRILKEAASVPGTVRVVAGSPTSVEFVPLAPLEPGAEYQLVVGTGIVDLAGDAVETPLSVPFATAAAPAGPAAPTPEAPVTDGPLGLLAISLGGIVVYDPDGPYFERISNPADERPDDPFTHDFFPAWSRDGARLAVSRITGEYDPAFGNVSHIHVMNADGSNRVRITPVDGHAMRPTWSPDGNRIAFQTRRNEVGNDEIYVMDADGSNPVRLTNSRQPSWGPAWSPDGSRIAYVSYSETGDADIFVMNPDGSGVVNLTNDAGFDDDPDWSPDGTRIAFSKGTDLYVMNADGTNPVRIELGPPAIWAADPKWAPDGLSILYATYAGCDWGETGCIEYTGSPATIVRLSDGTQQPLPPSREGLTPGHWSWRE